jgi:hypothetical protein
MVIQVDIAIKLEGRSGRVPWIALGRTQPHLPDVLPDQQAADHVGGLVHKQRLGLSHALALPTRRRWAMSPESMRSCPPPWSRPGAKCL